MRILVLGNEQSFSELVQLSSTAQWFKAADFSTFDKDENADAYFNLLDDAGLMKYSNNKKPVFINSVTHTLSENNHTENIIRFNGWKGFMKRDTWELSGKIGDVHDEILNTINKNKISLPDEPGFISPRVIAMIVNEAYFAKQENVSTEDEIDIAMKLGTNYPKGPFEWAKEVGIKNIFTLLKTLSISDKKYTPAALLEFETLQK